MKNSHTLDFCVIGAQKSGTTSLHYYLREHPQLRLPDSKEAPFFSDIVEFSKGVSWYFEEFFHGHGNDSALLGTVSPTYMSYPVSVNRMYDSFPNIKLIAILKDPIERAKSHYKMRVRAHGETRSFEEVVLQQLDCIDQSKREFPTETDSYVFFGEYGRILTRYLDYFRQQQFLILYADELKRKPDSALKKIYQFLAVKPLTEAVNELSYNATLPIPPKNLKVNLANALNNRYVRLLGKRFVPERLKRRLRFWSVINRYDGKISGPIDVSLNNQTLQRLVDHYLIDMEVLEKSFMTSASWRDRFYKLKNER
jgi:hypothetical protein